jgi:NAD(P)-dependent dehydrogenase (short-subunit alcohol dehydrogenase family)
MTDQQKFAKLRGARVLIIGGTSGIGYGVAEGAIESQAAAVIVSSSSSSRVQDAVARLKASYPSSKTEISGYTCDLGDAATIENNIKHLLVDQCQNLDHIVYSAGDRLALKPLDQIDAQLIQKAGIVRFLGPILVAKYALKVLPKTAASSFIITSAKIAEKPLPGGWTVVAGYASAHYGLMRQLALDMAPIRINSVSPGFVTTEMYDFLGEDGKAARAKDAAEVSLTARTAVPEDVAEAYLYLMKDTNVTGATISTSGGSLLK